jgi:phage terminase large subunit GpA-like protein
MTSTTDFANQLEEQRLDNEDQWADLFRVKSRQNPDEWAEQHRVYPETAGVPGPRNPQLTPYMVPWSRAIAMGTCSIAVMVCAAQTGKTDSCLDVMGERLDNRPSPIIYVGPSREFCTDQFEPRLMTMFDEAPSLASKMTRARGLMKKTRKFVAGCPVRLAHAGSSTALKSDPAGLAIVDEYDEMLRNIKGQGDPLGLVMARGHTYSDFVAGVTSTPTLGASDVDDQGFWKVMDPEDVQSPIWRLFQTGTRRHWTWPCPHCGDYFIPRFSCLKWSGDTPADAERTAYVQCPFCGGVIEDVDKRLENDRGVYVAPGQEVNKNGRVLGNAPDSSTESFWVSGLCSPFTTFGQLAETYLNAVRMKDSERIQTVINSKFGELYKVGWDANAPKWQDVAEHKAAYFKGDLPDGIVHLIVTVDVQKNRLVYVARGWGARSTSWLVDWGEFYGETQHEEVWDTLADYITNNVCGMPVRLCLIDSGFRPGKRDELPFNRVYDFCRRYPRLVRATKGANHPMPVPLKVNKAFEVTVRGTAQKFGLELMRVDPDHFKSWVHERLHWPNDELGSWYIPQDVDDDYMKQIVAESRSRLPSGKVLWVVHSPQNHYLDCEALQAAGAHLLNFARMAPTKRRNLNVPPPHVVAGNKSPASRLAR